MDISHSPCAHDRRAAVSPGSPGSKVRVLVVDDDRASAGALAALLTLEGYEVTVAHGGLEALGRLDAFAPDVLITDVDMPGMDGLSLLRQVRSLRHGTIGLVMSGGETSASVALGSGAAGFLPKPVDLDEVLALLHAAIEDRDGRPQVEHGAW